MLEEPAFFTRPKLPWGRIADELRIRRTEGILRWLRRQMGNLARGATGSPGCGEDGDGATRSRSTAQTRTTKTQSTSSTSGDRSKITRADHDEEYERMVGFINRTYEGPIEGFDWDEDTITKRIHHYRNKLNPGRTSRDFWFCDEEPQLKELKEHLALYRIRALKEELRNLEDADLRCMYPSFEEEGYFEKHERSFKWYFDENYCHYAGLQDYQRLMLRNNGEYEDWKYYSQTCSTLESDQQFVQFWEELEKKLKWVTHFVDECTRVVWHRLEAVAYYHALKIAAGFPEIFNSLVSSGYSVMPLPHIQISRMDYKEALREVYEENRHCSIFRSDMKAELEKLDGKVIGGCGPLQSIYESYVAKIDGGATEGMFRHLMRPVIRNTVSIIGRKVYYDYAKEKLDIAKQIGVI
ncbi:hypothetical protein EJB05_03904, partial [Eragrostis curvula]